MPTGLVAARLHRLARSGSATASADAHHPATAKPRHDSPTTSASRAKRDSVGLRAAYRSLDTQQSPADEKGSSHSRDAHWSKVRREQAEQHEEGQNDTDAAHVPDHGSRFLRHRANGTHHAPSPLPLQALPWSPYPWGEPSISHELPSRPGTRPEAPRVAGHRHSTRSSTGSVAPVTDNPLSELGLRDTASRWGRRHRSLCPWGRRRRVRTTGYRVRRGPTPAPRAIGPL